MTSSASIRPYRGVFPVAPTIFDERGALDLDGQLRCIDFMIDAGSHGICILANFSEQFSLSDNERDRLMDAILDHVAGRVPVIVTTTHFATAVCVDRSRRAEAAGAAMVMIMPPYHGATIRVSDDRIFEFFERVAAAVSIPILIQDAPVSGTPLAAQLLARMARDMPNVLYFKLEVPPVAIKLETLTKLAGDSVEGPWDGEEGITLIADLKAGATGTMTGAGYPDGIRQIYDSFSRGEYAAAADAYARWLPLINYENRQCGLATAKILMHAGGIIASDSLRSPLSPVSPAQRAGLLELARSLDPLVLRWAT
ncbi:MAG: dihydrodipicolinate synthase family protein [Gammaproteobacteria bacterium]|jgi:4-hydroxy-tetrahydrodipicolinate synthase